MPRPSLPRFGRAGALSLVAIMPECDPEQYVLVQTTDSARRILDGLGFPSAPLSAAGSWSNVVWLAPKHIVRISSGRFSHSFAHEIATLQLLPATIPHAEVCAYGRVGQHEWMVQKRIAGQTLFEVWPELSLTTQRAAIVQLGAILRTLHAVRLPTGFANPWASAALSPGGQPQNAYHPPPAQYPILINAALRIPGVDHAIIHAAGNFIETRLPAFQGDTIVLVHNDIHFANIMWSDGAITALLDFEGAKPAPADQELDTLLRFAREPWHYGGRYQSRELTAGMVRDIPGYLQAAYPSLFLHPHHKKRLVVYEALWQLVQILNFASTDGVEIPLERLTTLLQQGERWMAYCA